ncbi:MAG: hypothetical protein ACOCQR_02990 [bacterium]
MWQDVYENCWDCVEYEDRRFDMICPECICQSCKYDRSKCLEQLRCFKTQEEIIIEG